MRGTEFLDKMELIDPVYVEEADRQPKKKKNVWAKWGSMAACLCVVAASALLIPKTWQLPDEPVADRSTSEVSNPEESIPQKENTAPTPEAPVQPSPDKVTIEPSNENATDGTNKSNQATNGGVDIYAPNNQEPQNVIPMISGDGDITYDPDMCVHNGYAVLSQALQTAMVTHADTAHYQVFVILFSDGVQIAADSELALNEVQRLVDLGYIVAQEIHNKTDHYLTLHATYEQLKNFQAAEHLGYSLMLYNEYFGAPTSPDPGVVFNGSAPCS